MSAISWFLLGASTGAVVAAATRLPWANARAAPRRAPSFLLLGALGAMLFAAAAAAMLLVVAPRRAAGAHPHPAVFPATAASAPAAQRAAPMDVAAAGLAARLERQGGTPEDWNLLAQSYDFLGRPRDAERARERAAEEAARESLRFPAPASAGAPRAAIAH